MAEPINLLTESLNQLTRIRSTPAALQPLVAEMLWFGTQRDDPPSALREALALLLPSFGANHAALWRATKAAGN